MTKLGTVKFSGLSGTRYSFAAYPLGAPFRKAFGGVYVVTRRRQGKSSGGFTHKRLRTGQCGDMRQWLADEARSLTAQGANCICVHAEKDPSAREKMTQDLPPIPKTAG